MISKEQKNKIDNFLFELSGEEKQYLLSCFSISKEVKEEKIRVNWEALLKQFNDITGKGAKVISQPVKNSFLARLREGYSKQDILNTIKNVYNDSYHKEMNYKYLTLEFVSRSKTVEKYFNIKKP